MLSHRERTRGQVGRASQVRKGHVWFMKHVGQVVSCQFFFFKAEATDVIMSGNVRVS